MISEWIMRITGTALICSALISLTPEGAVKKVVRLVCGTAAVIALISITAEFEYNSFSENLEAYRAEYGGISADSEDNSRILTRFIIEENSAAYILDKAEELGINGVSAQITADWSDSGFWYPVSAEISGSIDLSAREKLTRYIESELGIPREAQTWSTDDEN